MAEEETATGTGLDAFVTGNKLQFLHGPQWRREWVTDKLLMMRPGSWCLELATHTPTVCLRATWWSLGDFTLFFSLSVIIFIFMYYFGDILPSSNIHDADIKTEEGNEQK